MDHQQLRELLAKKSLERQKTRDDLPATAEGQQAAATTGQGQPQSGVEGQQTTAVIPGTTHSELCCSLCVVVNLFKSCNDSLEF